MSLSNDDLEKRISELSADVEALKSELALLKKPQPIRNTWVPTKPPPTFINKGFENFVGLKLIHFVGIIILLIGLTIGVQYAIDLNLVSPLVRITGAYIASVILFVLSLNLRKKYELFSVILFGGSMASGYFTTYAAYEYYSLINRPAAFIIMLLLTVFTVYNALKYNRQEIAFLGLVGAYAIPFFVRGNTNNITGLLIYVSFINAGVLFISFKKNWEYLNHSAFIITWIILLSAIFSDVDLDYFCSEIFFIFIFFALFLATSVGIRLVKRLLLTDLDIIVLAGNTIFLYVSLNHLFNFKESIETITLIFGIMYFLASFIVNKWLAQNKLAIILFYISLISITSYIAMKYTGVTTTIIWVILAVIIFLSGMWTRIKGLRMAAIFLFAITLLKLLFLDSPGFTSIEKIITYIFTGTVLLIISFLYQKFKNTIFKDE